MKKQILNKRQLKALKLYKKGDIDKKTYNKAYAYELSLKRKR